MADILRAYLHSQIRQHTRALRIVSYLALFGSLIRCHHSDTVFKYQAAPLPLWHCSTLLVQDLGAFRLVV
jgi:hypothetical protein